MPRGASTTDYCSFTGGSDGQRSPPVKSIVIDQLGTGTQPTTDDGLDMTLSSPERKC